MGENTNIEWAHHTFNPWEGCTKVGPGCDHCYAETRNKRFHGGNWGPGAPRRRTSPANWAKPRRWNTQAAEKGVRYRVFCASLADVFDNEVPAEWRADLFKLISETPNLDWLLLTKRIGNVAGMLPSDWDNGWPNVWLGATVVNQQEADRDIPKLLGTPAAVRWLSMEPLLELVIITEWLHRGDHDLATMDPMAASMLSASEEDGTGWVRPAVDWVIVGGESGTEARPMHREWARDLRDQCVFAGVPFLFKQWGEWVPGQMLDEQPDAPLGEFHSWADWVDGCICAEGDGPMFRVGKKKAGRLLDGRTWDQFPGGAA